ncbi:hypothetical protein AB0R11_14870, partial [Streptomyces fradiae]
GRRRLPRGPAAPRARLAVLALRRGTRRRGRALLGLALGAADLALLAVLAAASGTVSWHLG